MTELDGEQGRVDLKSDRMQLINEEEKDSEKSTALYIARVIISCTLKWAFGRSYLLISCSVHANIFFSFSI